MAETLTIDDVVLTIGKLGAGQADYYLKAVGQGVEDYYTGAGEAPGTWLGAASGELELTGEVGSGPLHRALTGLHPATGDQLARPPRGGIRVPGFDLTFSAPKSVSVLYALGDDATRAQVREAHDAAVRSALNYMERHAAMGRRGKGGQVSVLGNGFLGAAFRHRTSRAGDPQLHTHVLVANMTRGPDQRWTALDGRHLYTHAKTGGYLYQAQLRAELVRRLGLRFTPVRRGVSEIDGLPKPLLKTFSRRRTEIEAELEARGESTPAAAQVAALHSRKSKEYDVEPESLYDRWADRAREHDYDPGRTAELVGRDTPRQLDEPAVQAAEQRLGGAEGVTQRRSSFTRRDTIQAWCEQLPQGADVDLVEDLAERFVTGEHAVPLATDVRSLTRSDAIRRPDGRLVPATADERRFSTPELLALERRVLDHAARTDRPARGQTSSATLDRLLSDRSELTDEQAAMVRAVCGDGRPVSVVVGKAGAGKTYALDVARQAWQYDGHRVIGAALARRAAIELEHGSGIPSASIAALLHDLRRDPTALLNSKTVLVVDEAGMVGTRQLAELLEHTDDVGAKVVLVGDHRQLPEIDAGGIFRGLVARGHAVELRENRRQSEPWEREALDQLRDGRIPEALAAYESHGRITVGQTAGDARGALVSDWWQARQGGTLGVMLALRRSDVADLNARARALLAADRQLTGDAVAVDDRVFQAGDEIVCLKNDQHLAVTNGTVLTVEHADPEQRALITRRQNGDRVDLTAAYLDDRTLRGGATVDHAYALTAHKAQGMTTGQTFVLGSDALYQEWGYVALSRGREANRLYLVADPEHDDRPHAVDPLQRTSAALGRSQAHDLATDAALVAKLTKAPVEELQGERRRLASQLDERGALTRELKRLEPLIGEDRYDAPDRMGGSDARRQQLSARAEQLHSRLAELPSATTLHDRVAAVDDELNRRARTVGRMQEAAPADYLLRALGRPPDSLADRAQWRTAAWRIEQARELTGHDHAKEPLGERPHELQARRAWDDARRDIDRYHEAAAGRQRDTPARELG